MKEGGVKKPGWVLFVLGVVYPAVVIAFEIYSEMCAETFFDPIPTVWHILLVSCVPLSNLLLWLQLRNEQFDCLNRLSFFAGVSLGISGFYALVFLPITPVAVFAVLLFGMGLLALAPLISFIALCKLYSRFNEQYQLKGIRRSHFWKGISVALLALVLLDVPTAVTHVGIKWAASDSPEESEKGVQWLRALGDEELLLRQCFDNTRRATGPLSFATALITQGGMSVPSSSVREIFYRVTGESFNVRELPYSGGGWGRGFNDFQFDRDQGGAVVGSRIKGLDLVSSRIDGSIDSDSAVAYLEWVLEFRNSSRVPREARLQIALPPEAVVSRVTLWVNGEEREAAFAGRSEARQAYQSVVRSQRDPLLVTTQGSDRIMAQAFPIAPQGGTIKFRIGITAPLHMPTSDQAQLVLPTIVDRNFNITGNLKHSLWVEGKHPLKTSLDTAKSDKVNSALYRLTANLSDLELSNPRILITSGRNAEAMKTWSEGNNKSVIQSILAKQRTMADALLIVLDGSVKVAEHLDLIVESLKSIPEESPVGLIISGENELLVPIEKWSPSHEQTTIDAIRTMGFTGGQDNSYALAKAFGELERYDNGHLLWIHTPQPVVFKNGAAKLEQTANRLTQLPEVSLYNLQPGPNKLMDESNWAWQANTISRLGAQDLKHYYLRIFKPGIEYSRQITEGLPKNNLAKGSEHLLRLWANKQVKFLLKQNRKDNLKAAIAIAAEYQLVTPVSGAVVLESETQYKDNDLSPVDPNSVPTIPEPHQWMLAIIIVVLMIWFLLRHRHLLLRQA